MVWCIVVYFLKNCKGDYVTVIWLDISFVFNCSAVKSPVVGRAFNSARSLVNSSCEMVLAVQLPLVVIVVAPVAVIVVGAIVMAAVNAVFAAAA